MVYAQNIKRLKAFWNRIYLPSHRGCRLICTVLAITPQIYVYRHLFVSEKRDKPVDKIRLKRSESRMLFDEGRQLR